MKTLTIELSAESCKKALDELKKYRDEIKPKLDEVCKRLAEIGRQEASAIINGAARSTPGNTHAHTSVEKIENGYKIVMEGQDVYFIEFGTGIFAGEYAGDTSNVTVGVMPGDWSDTHARQFSNYGYWFYEGQFLRGTPAYMPMYYAGKKMREEMPKVVKEVFGK
jgi:hypothetical protein